jgi:hypothetical protein
MEEDADAEEAREMTIELEHELEEARRCISEVEKRAGDIETKLEEQTDAAGFGCNLLRTGR